MLSSTMEPDMLTRVFPNTPPKGARLRVPQQRFVRSTQKPTERPGLQFPMTFSIKEKIDIFIRECPGKREKDTNYTATEKGSIKSLLSKLRSKAV